MSEPSNDSPKPERKNYWEAWMPQPDNAAIRALSGKIYYPVNYNNIDDQGIVHIHIPPVLRDPKNFRLPAWMPHIDDRTHYHHDFDPAWRANYNKNEPSPTLTFWLTPGAFPPDTPRERIDEAVQNFATQLGIKHGIPDLQAMYCVPKWSYREQFQNETLGAVILYAHPINAHKLQAVRETIHSEREAFLTTPKPPTWEERLNANKEKTYARGKLAMREVMHDMHDLLAIQPARIENTGHVWVHFNRLAHQILDHHVDEPVDYYLPKPLGISRMDCFGTNGLAVMLTPDFLDRNDYETSRQSDDHRPAAERQQAYFNDAIAPKITAFAAAMSHRCRIPIKAEFHQLASSDFHDCEAIAPNMLVLMTTPEHEKTLMREGRAELIRQYRASLLAHANDRPSPNNSAPSR